VASSNSRAYDSGDQELSAAVGAICLTDKQLRPLLLAGGGPAKSPRDAAKDGSAADVSRRQPAAGSHQGHLQLGTSCCSSSSSSNCPPSREMPMLVTRGPTISVCWAAHQVALQLAAMQRGRGCSISRHLQELSQITVGLILLASTDPAAALSTEPAAKRKKSSGPRP